MVHVNLAPLADMCGDGHVLWVRAPVRSWRSLREWEEGRALATTKIIVADLVPIFEVHAAIHVACVCHEAILFVWSLPSGGGVTCGILKDWVESRRLGPILVEGVCRISWHCHANASSISTSMRCVELIWSTIHDG